MKKKSSKKNLSKIIKNKNNKNKNTQIEIKRNYPTFLSHKRNLRHEYSIIFLESENKISSNFNTFCSPLCFCVVSDENTQIYTDIHRYTQIYTDIHRYTQHNITQHNTTQQ
jgi:hypothetical protein